MLLEDAVTTCEGEGQVTIGMQFMADLKLDAIHAKASGSRRNLRCAVE
jgi:hypothetical protein